MESLNAADSGSWLRPMLDPTARDMHCVVPHGFSAYARVLHPASRDRPADTLSWHTQNREVLVDVDSESVQWSEVARTFGTSMHALAQYHRLSGPAAGPYGEVLDAAGWRYSEPWQGNLDIQVLAAAALILSRHTTTPGKGVAAIWEGWGGLTSSAGYSQLSFDPDGGGGRGTVTLGAEDGAGSGILPASVVRGPHQKVAEGLRWVYAHEHLAPLAWSRHIWFIGTGLLGRGAAGAHSVGPGAGGVGVGTRYGVR